MVFVIEKKCIIKSLHFIKNLYVRDENLKINILTFPFFFFFFWTLKKKEYDSVPIYNVLMKIHHFGIRGLRAIKYIENLYILIFQGLCKALIGHYQNHLVL